MITMLLLLLLLCDFILIKKEEEKKRRKERKISAYLLTQKQLWMYFCFYQETKAIFETKKKQQNLNENRIFYECQIGQFSLISICTMWCMIISLTICKAVRIRLLSHYYHHHQCPTMQNTIVVSTAIAVNDSLKRTNVLAHSLSYKMDGGEEKAKEGREGKRENAIKKRKCNVRWLVFFSFSFSSSFFSLSPVRSSF